MCNGQVLVLQDMIGVFRDFTPRHVKKYANAGDIIEEAARNYIKEINEGVFPTDKNSFTIEDGIIEELKKLERE